MRRQLLVKVHRGFVDGAAWARRVGGAQMVAEGVLVYVDQAMRAAAGPVLESWQPRLWLDSATKSGLRS
jgi:hypothetical protein